jgi:hypothetical protein
VANKTAKNRSCAEVESNHVNEQNNAIETKGHLVTKMTPRAFFSGMTMYGHQFITKKQHFYRNLISESDSMATVNN